MRHWFEDAADHLGAAYLRYSFTYGTRNEVDFLVDALGLEPGACVLDVGCGPGRHAHALARRGMRVLGVDISETFVDLARHEGVDGAEFRRLDAAEMSFDAEFDAVISLCQGAFGLPADPAVPLSDGRILTAMARALKPGGGLAVSAFSAYFQVRYLDEANTFDAAAGVNHETTELRDADGKAVEADLWTSCFTPRELRLLAAAAGLTVDAVHSVTPGGYAADAPTIESPEFLLLARRPGSQSGGARGPVG